MGFPRSLPDAAAALSSRLYFTSSSSTQKWSVAFGGIGPPGVPRGP